MNTIGADDEPAIEQLRQLLLDEQDPIDRHYMLSELEERLYRCRDRRDSALTEFDAVCLEHHGEMPALRPALVKKFGVVPVIEMYRQASIRFQKAKRWELAREWAQRGLDVYGDQAGRAEVIEDLQKRVAYASSKLEAPIKSKARSPHAIGVATSSDVVPIETLVCVSCGETFERPATRGRKPKLCVACRARS